MSGKWSSAVRKCHLRASLPVFPPWLGHTAPISTNAHQVGKSLRLAEKNSLPARPLASGTHLSGPNSALKYPNAHRVGKNDRAGAKKFQLRKIYIPGCDSSGALRLGPDQARTVFVLSFSTAFWASLAPIGQVSPQFRG